MSKRIGLLGLYASRNLGDTAIQQAVIDNLSARIEQAEFIGICPDPEDTRSTFGIQCVDFTGERHAGDEHASRPTGRLSELVPWRVRATWARVRALPGIRRCTAGLDLLVLSGGGQLDEFWGGPWNHPLQLFVWTRLARLQGVPVAAIGLGMDVLESRAARWLCVAAMRASCVRAFRDSGTAAAIAEFGLREPLMVAPDLAFSLRVPPVESASRPTGLPPFVAVAAISDRALVSQVASAHGNYIGHLATACRDWLARGLHVRLVCSQPQMDLPVIERIAAQLPPSDSGQRWEIAETTSVAGYLDAVRGAELVVASRLHGLILALLAESPVIAVVGNRKVQQLMRDVGFNDYCVGLPDLTAAALLQVAGRIRQQRGSLVEVIVRYNSHARRSLAAMYDQVAGLLA
jgi:polysaccharide pyruvyl transferase WcaK-like protein